MEIKIDSKRFDEMVEELNTLRAQLKAAQEQEPVYFWREIGETDWIQCHKNWYEKCQSSPEHDTKVLYAAPVPADHTKEWRGTNEYGLDMGYISGKLGIMLRDLDRHTPSEAARVLARLAMVADSSVLNEEEFRTADHIPDAGKKVCAWAVIAGNGNIRAWSSTRDHPTLKNLESEGCQVVQMVLSPATVKDSLTVAEAPSPRITEQDAREIVSRFTMFRRPGYLQFADEKFSAWLQEDGRAMLDKLNAGRADHIAEAGKMINTIGRPSHESEQRAAQDNER